MAFTDFKQPQDALDRFSIHVKKSNLFNAAHSETAPEWIARAVRIGKRFKKLSNSEIYAREFFIAPILGYLLEPRVLLDLYSSEYRFNIDETLSGVPDYLIAYAQSVQDGVSNARRPLLAVAEAKNENFGAGWAQCIAQLVAAQRVNDSADTPVWGVVTTGRHWEFAYLQENVLHWHEDSLDLDPLDKLVSILTYIFDDCEKNGAAFDPITD